MNPVPEWGWTDELEDSQTKVSGTAIVTAIDLMLGIAGLSLSAFGLSSGTEAATIIYKLDNIQQTVNSIQTSIDNFYRTYQLDKYTDKLEEHTTMVASLFEESKNRLPEVNKNCEENPQEALAIINAWINGPDLTKRNLNNLATALGKFRTFTGGLPIISTIYNIASYSRVWEEDTYDWMYKIVCNEILALAPALMMAGYYYANLADPADKVQNEASFKKMQEDFKYMFETRDAVVKANKMRSDSYRVNMHDHCTYSPACLGPCNFALWLMLNCRLSYFPRDNEYDNAVKSCDKMFKECSQNKDCITADEWRNIIDTDRNRFHAEMPVEDYFLKHLKFSCSQSDRLKFYYCQDEKFHREDKALPYCSIFHWESHAGLLVDDDNFFVKKWDGGFENVLTDCNISTWDGEITHIGKPQFYNWYTIEKVSDKGYVQTVLDLLQ